MPTNTSNLERRSFGSWRLLSEGTEMMVHNMYNAYTYNSNYHFSFTYCPKNKKEENIQKTIMDIE